MYRICARHRNQALEKNLNLFIQYCWAYLNCHVGFVLPGLLHDSRGNWEGSHLHALWPAVGRWKRLWESATLNKQCKPLPPGDQPLAKEPEDSGYETGESGRSLKQNKTFCLLLSIITRRIKL